MEPFSHFQATLLGPDLTHPDLLVFASPEKLNSSGWTVPIEDRPLRDSSSGLPDTGYALFWNPKALPVGATKIVATMAGLSAPALQSGQTLDTALFAPRQISADGYSVIALIHNKDRFRAVRNVRIELGLPDRSTVRSKIPAIQPLPEINPDAVKFLYYYIDASAMPAGEATVTLTVRGEANNAPTITTTRRRIRK